MLFLLADGETGYDDSYICPTRSVICKDTHMCSRTHPVHLALVVPHVDVGVHEGLVHRDPLFRVNHEHLGEEITSHAGLKTGNINILSAHLGYHTAY